MDISRRDFLKASAVIASAVGLGGAGALRTRQALAAQGASPVIWLQGQTCSGCSVSLLNSIYYTTIDSLLTQTIDLRYHPTLMAGAGQQAVGAATATLAQGGYILVIEGAVPTGAAGKYCQVWPGMTMATAAKQFAAKAAFVLAVGNCASFGGIPAAKGGKTAARSVQAAIGAKPKVINLPGCPAHPDWVVGTVAYILQHHAAPPLDVRGRPTDYYGTAVHANCPNLSYYTVGQFARTPGAVGCQRLMGCRGPETNCDCPTRRWNSGAANTAGVNWCIGAGAPCIGCTEIRFPDADSPMQGMRGTPWGTPASLSHGNGQACSTCHGSKGGGGGSGGTGGGVNCSQCHGDGRTGNPPGTLPSGHPRI